MESPEADRRKEASMELTRESARRQAMRLQSSALLAPKSDEGRTEIIDCIMRHCQSAEHAELVMTAVLDGSIDVKNMTAEIAAVAKRTRKAEVPPNGCERCAIDPDINTGESRWSPYVSVSRNGCAFARRCDCARGRWLAAADRAREVVA